MKNRPGQMTGAVKLCNSENPKPNRLSMLNGFMTKKNSSLIGWTNLTGD
jgi:hypothetical protein